MNLRARGYYWKIVVPAIARALGEAKFRDTHDWLKYQFLPCGDDDEVPIEQNGCSTKVSQMEDKDFADYLFRVVTWARAAGIDVPPSHREDA